MNWETLLSFGDSITIGSRSYLAYPEYAGDFLESHTHKSWSVHNVAVSRYTCIDLNRYLTDNYSHLMAMKPEIMTLMIGTNDAKIGTSTSNYRIAYNQLLVKARLINRESPLLLVKIPMLTDGVILPYALSMNQTIISYNKIIEELAAKHKLETLSLNLDAKYFFDGVHFNEAGSRAAGQQVGKYVLWQRGIKIE